MNSARRRWVLRQWVWLLGPLIAVALAYWSGIFWRIDFAIYDAALPSVPLPSDVVIVAVDDASIAELGRWPWPRSVHAALLDRLREAGARAVELDFLFTEPDASAPSSDAALAAAMSRGPPTVLPSFAYMSDSGGPLHEQLPIPILTRAAAAIGHPQLEMDPDGIVRSVFLREGLGAPTRPYLAAALLQSIPGAAPLRWMGERHPDVPAAPDRWVRDYRMMIPFLKPPAHFPQLSYVDVLRGAVPPSALRGKIVLAGVTAQGLGDALPTPRSGYSRPMAGVEVTANVLQTLRSGTGIRPVSMPTAILLGCIPMLIVAIGLQHLPPRYSLLLVVMLWLGTLGAGMVLLRSFYWWWPPTAPLAALLLAYPLWSWRRLELTQSFLEEELAQLAREEFPLLSAAPAGAPPPGRGDVLIRRIDLMRRATQRLRAVQREREDVVRFLSHDMKSPAASLLGLAQLQRDPGRALPPQELSRRLDLLAHRMVALVDDFVALARAESADPKAFDDVDLRDAVQDAYDEVWAAAQARNVTIRLHEPEDTCWVSGDRQLLARAVVNLLSNAVKFSSPGCDVQLTCELRDHSVVVSVADDGPGIEPERRASLFQRFSRGAHRGNPDPGGAGLGLAFVRVVAEKHRGHAWADDDRQVGAAFHFSVPVNTTVPVNAPEPAQFHAAENVLRAP
jgi:CHASE2 domain-containing sensor protein/two-component sensor histidine kinase